MVSEVSKFASFTLRPKIQKVGQFRVVHPSCTKESINRLIAYSWQIIANHEKNVRVLQTASINFLNSIIPEFGKHNCNVDDACYDISVQWAKLNDFCICVCFFHVWHASSMFFVMFTIRHVTSVSAEPYAQILHITEISPFTSIL